MKNHTLLLALFSFLLLLFCLPPTEVHAQYRPSIDVQEWPSGKVVLVSGDTIYGPITFYRTEDIVSVLHEDGSKSLYAPVNVQYFVAQEEPSGRAYTFLSLMWNLGRDYTDFKKPTFFEQLNQGTLKLIMREEYLRKDMSVTSPMYASTHLYTSESYVPGSEWVEYIKPLYYIELPDGEIVTLRNVKRDLNRLFGNKSREVRKYINEKRLTYEKPHHLMAIVNYYNSLK